jgi:polar amino acid transport system substrate-binding protein
MVLIYLLLKNKNNNYWRLRVFMKKLISIVLMVALIFTLTTGCSSNNAKPAETKKEGTAEPAKKEKLVMYTNAEFAPFEYFKGEKIVGVDVDIANEIAKDMGRELEVVHIDFSSIIPAVVEGKADFGAAGMTITAERQEQVDFSIGYVESIQHLIYKTNAPLKTMAELKGKKIGVQLGTTGDLAVTDAINNGDLKGTGAQVLTYKNALEASQDLLAGRLDVVVIDKLTAENIVKNNSDKLSTSIFGEISETYGICVKKGNKELLDSINKTLQKLKDAGKIEEFIANHSK